MPERKGVAGVIRSLGRVDVLKTDEELNGRFSFCAFYMHHPCIPNYATSCLIGRLRLNRVGIDSSVLCRQEVWRSRRALGSRDVPDLHGPRYAGQPLLGKVDLCLLLSSAKQERGTSGSPPPSTLACLRLGKKDKGPSESSALLFPRTIWRHSETPEPTCFISKKRHASHRTARE